MAKISKFAMADALRGRGDISLRSTMFGLGESATYTTTGSPLRGVKLDYASSDLPRLQRVLDAQPGRVAAAVQAAEVSPAAVGNVRVEACLSRDGAFAAVQLLRFADYLYTPIAEPRFFTGPDAEALCRFFS